jgi:hypothetical protein
MIVRISGEDQYELPDEDVSRLNELEGDVAAIIDSGRNGDFAEAYRVLLEYVRANGRVVSDDELASSDVILPPADLTFAEAGTEFTGEGLIPD